MGANQLFGVLSAVPIAAQQRLNFRVCMNFFYREPTAIARRFCTQSAAAGLGAARCNNFQLH
ncbi:hypothetical protein [Nostoc sp. DedQUE07]|uniref:hypothetical protein n=1 Tax=Nostoc sp. DedQUE07 TaxID=3075392 RepID=UPI002AD2E3F9|nr:hypothetical protein [Nostoc sp. DedQUE07]MDZ8128711.1 hypothetical protein [Nostoc sp. DedQUE07]